MTSTPFRLADGDFSQSWDDANLIKTGDANTLPNVASIEVFSSVASAPSGSGSDPASITGESVTATFSSGTPSSTAFGAVNASGDTYFANGTDAQAVSASAGGVYEFDQTLHTLAFQGSGTALAPNLELFLDASSTRNVTVSFDARDLDTAADTGPGQAIAVQYRFGSGAWTTVGSDAGTGTLTATSADGQAVATTNGDVIVTDGSGHATSPGTTTITAALPTAADGHADLQVRILTENQVGNDQMVGVDNLRAHADPAAAVTSTFSVGDASVAEGNSGQTPLVFTVTRAGDLSEAATVHYATADGTATAADGDYLSTSGDLTFAAHQSSATVTVQVNGDTKVEPDETFAVTLSGPSSGTGLDRASGTGTIVNDDAGSPSSFTPIYDIQGASHTSPLNGQHVTTQGVVTAIDTTGSPGFYIQDPTGDGDDATSDAVFVYVGSGAMPNVHVGDLVQLAGTVTEYNGGQTNSLTLTEITGPQDVSVLSSGHQITPVVIGDAAGERHIPTQVIDSDHLASFNPDGDAIDFYESLEGMVVTVPNARAVDATYSGETWVVADDGSTAPGLNARGGVTITPGDAAAHGGDAAYADYEPERIEVYADTGVAKTGAYAYNEGDHLGDVTGVISYYGGEYELVPTQAPGVTTSAGAPADDVTTLASSASHLTVGAYNVDNLGPVGTGSTDTATRYAALGHDIAVNLGAPVILGVEEIQDADGEGSGSNLSGAATLTDLTQAVQAAGGPAYSFVEVAPTTANSTGGAPNGNIRSAFLYDASKVQLVDGSVRLIDDPNNPSTNPNGTFHNSREPLAADFIFHGEKITVIDVHQYSRGGSDELFGQDQPPNISGDARRTAMADAVLHYVQGLEAADPTAKIVVEGDFNGFYFEKALTDLGQTNAAGQPTLVNLVTTLPENERYSYNFEGDSEQLDNLLVSPNLVGGALFDDVHVNTGVLASAVTDPAGAASDHDPILAQLTINAAPSTATDSYLVAENGALKVNADHGVLSNDSDPNGDAITATLQAGPSHGALTLGSDGGFTYTPATGYHGADSFSYVAQDGQGGTSGATTVSLTVDAPPTLAAGAPSATLVEAGHATGGVTTSVVHLTPADADGAPTYDTSGWVDLGGGAYSRNGSYGSAVLDTVHDTLTYTLDNGRAQTDALPQGASASDSFTVTVTDGDLSTSTPVSFAITGSDDAPTLSAGAPSATLVEAGAPGPGVATSVVQLSPHDVDSVVAFDTSRWTNLGGGEYYKNGVYGSAVLDTVHDTLTYTLDNSRAATDHLPQNAHASEFFTVTDTDGTYSASVLVAFSITGSADTPVTAGSAMQAAVADHAAMSALLALPVIDSHPVAGVI